MPEIPISAGAITVLTKAVVAHPATVHASSLIPLHVGEIKGVLYKIEDVTQIVWRIVTTIAKDFKLELDDCVGIATVITADMLRALYNEGMAPSLISYALYRKLALEDINVICTLYQRSA